MDVPLAALVFIPFHLVWITIGVGTPVAMVRYARWRRAASARTSDGCCGACGSRLERMATYFITGVPVCHACANRLRRRLGAWMLAVAAVVPALLMLSGSAVIADLLLDREQAWRFWTTGARVAFVGIPALAVLATTATAIGVGRLANRMAVARHEARLLTGRDLPLHARVLASFETPARTR